MKVAIVLGSARSDGHTSALVNCLANRLPITLFDLNDVTLTPFDYTHKNHQDDFSDIIRRLVEYNHIIFASPVYWYAMSAQLKIFFDRFTDLLTIHKPLGRQLKGLSCSVISTGSDAHLPESFVQQFTATFNYLKMNFLTSLYCQCEEGFSSSQHSQAIDGFVRMLLEHEE